MHFFSFWSSLLSAVLTYHVNWLHSFVSQPVEFFDCGTRVLILSKDGTLARRILNVLSFFIRTNISGAESDSLSKETTVFSSSTASPIELSNHPVVDSGLITSQNQFAQSKEDGLASASALFIRDSSNCERRTTVLLTSCRRSSQQLDSNTRYLRNYYDVRFQLSPDTIAKRDGAENAFANLISSIAKNDFQDFSLHDHFGTVGAGVGGPPTAAPCAFFVGSVPDKVNTREQSLLSVDDSNSAETDSQPIQVPLSRYLFFI